MATRNDSRVSRTVVRGSGSHPQIQQSFRVPRKPGRNPSASKIDSRGRDLQDALADVIRNLRVIGAIAVTAEVPAITQRSSTPIASSRRT
jgi:hypothetical protein